MASTQHKLQFISNTFVHLRTYPLRLTPIGNELALLGNIGALGHKNTTEFLRHCADTFEQTYWVPGSLEWDTRQAKAFGQKDELLGICQQFRNIIPMIQTKIVRPNGLHILGTTLWSYEEKAHFYQEDMTWLNTSLLFAPAALVLTHHAPHGLDHLVNRGNVGSWLIGRESIKRGKIMSNLSEHPELA